MTAPGSASPQRLVDTRESLGRDSGAAEELESDEIEPKKTSNQILRHELKEAYDALNRPALRLVVSGFSAGMELGFGLLLMARVRTLIFPLDVASTEFLTAVCYAFGFVLVVIGRSELFTEQTTLAVMPVLDRGASIGSLIRLWVLVYAGNLLGAAFIAKLIVVTMNGLHLVRPGVFTGLALQAIDHPSWVIVLSGILAGWLMGLLSWVVAAGRDTISQIVIVAMVTTGIGLGHLHHAIEGAIATLAGMFESDQVSLYGFGYLLLWSTIGNAIGGPVFVATVKHAIARSDHTNR